MRLLCYNTLIEHQLIIYTYRLELKMFTRLYLKLKRYKFFHALFSFIEKMGEKNLASYAAAISFYFFISIIPIVVLLASQLPHTGISRQALINAVSGITPNSLDGVVEAVISQAYSMRMSVFSVSALFLLWASSKLMLSVMRSLEDIYYQHESRNIFTVLFYAILYTVLLLAIAIIGVIFVSKKMVIFLKNREITIAI